MTSNNKAVKGWRVILSIHRAAEKVILGNRASGMGSSRQLGFRKRLSGNSERASFRGPKSPHEGAKWRNFPRSALPRKARSDPFRYFPDSLSRKLVNRCKGSSYLPMPYVLEAPGAAR